MRSIVRKALFPSALLVGCTTVTAVSMTEVGCSSSSGTPEPTSSGVGTTGSGTGTPEGNVGSVGFQLTLPGGEQLNTVTWTITGPNGASTVVQTGTVNVANSLSVSFVVGNLPAGSGYSISLTGTTTDGVTTCAGSTTFSVAARAQATVSVLLQCTQPATEAGSAFINANTVNCATWNSVSAVPSTAIVGASVTVSASAVAPNPSGISYAWSLVSGTGTFSSATSQTTQFTCGAAGTATLQVTMSDSDAGSCGSLASTTLQIACTGHLDAAQSFVTATKIKHLIVIFNENNSFDHYFGTYPSAQNNMGEPYFSPAPGTPIPNNLINPLNVQAGFTSLSEPSLLTANPTASNTINGTGATNPFRLAPAYAETKSQNHSYTPEQEAADGLDAAVGALMDEYPKYTGTAGPPPNVDAGAPAQSVTTGLVMAYYDGNTLQTYWNWAQQYALNDNMWTTAFGPSTPGALNVISGQLNGLIESPTTPVAFSTGSNVIGDGNGGLSLIGDVDPAGDACEGQGSGTDAQGTMSGENIGMLLNGQNITWGWFQGGFNLTLTNANGTTGCTRSSVEGNATQTYATTGVGGPVTVPFPATSFDYIEHHNPFQFYPATQNLSHARPSSCPATGSCSGTATASIGYTNVPGTGTADAANHMYDALDFFATLAAGNLPAVVYLKPPAYENGHPSNSDPLDEQNFANSVVTALQGAQEWSSSLVVITYDDSDGWYDHQGPPIVNLSTTTADKLNGSSLCNSGVQQTPDGGAATTMLNSWTLPDAGTPYPANGRCGYGTRVPLLVVSPFAKRNYIDHTLVDQSSVVRFIEDNWLGSQRIPGSFDAIAGVLQNMLTGD
ncbi:MAG TPA: alkaline phosphatase family protein [Polyangiaceae bacterium]|nr:alkaline phosphatase family protein [Polyangiaceae bacterium]